jgi:hypothetical protein
MLENIDYKFLYGGFYFISLSISGGAALFIDKAALIIG